MTVDRDLYAQVYAERFGEPPLREYALTDEDRLEVALVATEGQRKRRSRNGAALR